MIIYPSISFCSLIGTERFSHPWLTDINCTPGAINTSFPILTLARILQNSLTSVLSPISIEGDNKTEFSTFIFLPQLIDKIFN